LKQVAAAKKAADEQAAAEALAKKLAQEKAIADAKAKKAEEERVAAVAKAKAIADEKARLAAIPFPSLPQMSHPNPTDSMDNGGWTRVRHTPK